MGARFGIFSLILLGVGCATTQTQHLPPHTNLLPPNIQITNDKDLESVDYHLLKAAESQATKEYQWWITYKRASLWREQKPNFSCEKFALLAQDPVFPLAQIAFLRAHETCRADSPALKNLQALDHTSMPKWMQKTALQVALEKAVRDNDRPAQMRLSYEKSKEHLPPEQKVQLTEDALRLAQELNDQKYHNLLEKRLYQLRPSLKPNPGRSDWLAVAYDHRRLRHFEQAEKYYRLVIEDKKTSFSQKVKAYNGLRMALKNSRNKKAFLKVTRDLSQFVSVALKKNSKSQSYRKVFHDTHVTLARAEWTEGKVKSARATLLKIEKTLKKKHSLSEVYWLLGRMDEEKSQFASAHEWFKKASEEPKLSLESKEKILWSMAWVERKLKNHGEAIATLTKLIEITENDFAKTRYQFWLAQTYSDQGDNTKAQLAFQDLINQDPLGYYGLLAHKKTDQLIPANEQLLARMPSSEPAEESALESVMDRQLVEWMISLNEHDLSKRYLDEVSSQLRKRENQTDTAWLKIFNYYARSGDYLALFEELGKLSPERRKQILDNHPGLIFPRPYEDLVKKAAKDFGISAELIYSIMRQESAFNPRARSFADAFGLLQMLPEVAKKQASAANVAYEKPEDLYKPEVNIPVGASFIKKLEIQWNNQFIPTVASYNASDKAIRGWLQTRYKGDSIEFIEDIPYEETRGYVRLVIRNLIFYQLMASDGQKIAFPDWILKLEPVAPAI